MNNVEAINNAMFQKASYYAKHGKNPDYMAMNANTAQRLASELQILFTVNIGSCPLQTINGIPIAQVDNLPDDFIKAVGD